MWSKVTGWVVVAVVTGLFLFRNSNTVEVDLVFSSVEMPLFVALLIAVVLGAVLGSGLMMLRARAKSKAATAKAKK